MAPRIRGEPPLGSTHPEALLISALSPLSKQGASGPGNKYNTRIGFPKRAETRKGMLRLEKMRERAPTKLRTEPDEKDLVLSKSSSYSINNLKSCTQSMNHTMLKTKITKEKSARRKEVSKAEGFDSKSVSALLSHLNESKRFSFEAMNASNALLKKIFIKNIENPGSKTTRRSAKAKEKFLAVKKDEFAIQAFEPQEQTAKSKKKEEWEASNNETVHNIDTSTSFLEAEFDRKTGSTFQKAPPQSLQNLPRVPIEALKIKNFSQALGKKTPTQNKSKESLAATDRAALCQGRLSSQRRGMSKEKENFSSRAVTPLTKRSERPNTAKESNRSSSVLEKKLKQNPAIKNKTRCASAQPTRPSGPVNFTKNIRAALGRESDRLKVTPDRFSATERGKEKHQPEEPSEPLRERKKSANSRTPDPSKAKEGGSRSPCNRVLKRNDANQSNALEACKTEAPNNVTKKISLVLYSPCSLGAKKPKRNESPQTRQLAQRATEARKENDANPQLQGARGRGVRKKDAQFSSVETKKQLRAENKLSAALVLFKNAEGKGAAATASTSDSVNSSLSKYVTKIAPIGNALASSVPNLTAHGACIKEQNVSAMLSNRRKPSPGERMISLKRGERNSCIYYMSELEKHYSGSDSNSRNYFAQLFKEHFFQSFQSIQYAKKLDYLLLEEFPASKKLFLPRRASHVGKKTLVFDLDETLIHCTEGSESPADIQISIKTPSGDTMTAGVNIRPHASWCLKTLSEHFEIIIFTASHSCYANQIISYLDPEQKSVHHRVFRENCFITKEGVYIKDLRVFGDRDISQIALVDNACYSFALQIPNGVPILPFYDNKEDSELKTLAAYLLEFLNSDIRDLNRATFRLNLHSECESPDEVLLRMFPD